MTISNFKTAFQDALNHLMVNAGLSIPDISAKTNFKASKLRNIRNGTSSADALMLKRLYFEYPDLLKDFIEKSGLNIEANHSEDEEERRVKKINEWLNEMREERLNRIEFLLRAFQKNEKLEEENERLNKQIEDLLEVLKNVSKKSDP